MLPELDKGRFITRRPPVFDTVPTGEFSSGIRIETLQESGLPAFREMIVGEIERTPYLDEDRRADMLHKRDEKFYRDGFANPDEWTFLTAKDGKGNLQGVVEATTFERDGFKVGLVQWVVVGEAGRNKGVATALYHDYEDRLRRRG